MSKVAIGLYDNPDELLQRARAILVKLKQCASENHAREDIREARLVIEAIDEWWTLKQ
jgi:hypothetical protein